MHAAGSCHMRYELTIFDGTLADSFPFFASVHNRLADRHGFHRTVPGDIEALRRLPAREVMRHVGLPRWKLPLVARSFVRLMGEADVRLLDDVAEALDSLLARGMAIALVSSNASDNCRRILGEAHWRRLVHVECGASIFGKRRRIARALKATGTPPGRAIYVGDQITDAEAARAAGVAFGAVAWGYGTPRSLQRLAPDHLFRRPGQLAELASPF